jgi:hypothetical protein
MLRRATSHGDEDQSPDGDDRAMYGGQYTPERRDGVVQSDPKKRKRNFSNRTKTGCLTCRKRKKKCDEKKPECEFESRHNILVSPRVVSQDALVYTRGHICGRIWPVLAADSPHRQQLLQGRFCLCRVSPAKGSLA